MSRFRKKPVIIEAVQWREHGDHPDVGYFRRPDVSGESICSECGCRFHTHGWIDTLEDGHRVCPGDWIITGIKGEKYPCKPDIFEATYEPVPEYVAKDPVAIAGQPQEDLGGRRIVDSVTTYGAYEPPI